MKPSATTDSDQTPAAGTRSGSLSALLQLAASGLLQIRKGRSGAVALDGAAPGLRPGAQALLYHVLRHLGLAEALRSRLAPRTPPPAADALLCTALALAAAPDDMPYEGFTLVNQAVEAAKGDAATRKQAAFINACLRRFCASAMPCWLPWQQTPLHDGTTRAGGSPACRKSGRTIGKACLLPTTPRHPWCFELMGKKPR